jgi:hypothetical protein
MKPAKAKKPKNSVAETVAEYQAGRRKAMSSIGFTYWQDGDGWLGHLDEFPDYMTQGTSLSDLKEHLLDLYKDLSSGAIPNVRRHAQLQLK